MTFSEDDLVGIAYSEATISDLKMVAAGMARNHPLNDEGIDRDFRRRYAEILLRERGV